jgi:catechol 2,3-dioxygenase-like lactoylglutathione lyase family enzyme
MIMGMSFVSVWVLNQDSAKDFYTKKLGCELTTDFTLDNGMRWLTVRPQGSTGQELLLMDPAHSMLDGPTAEQVRALVAKGALSPGVMATSDQSCAPTASKRSSGTTRATGTASPSATADPPPRPGCHRNRACGARGCRGAGGGVDWRDVHRSRA